MDRSLYVAMTGAGQTLAAQASVAHNLANANTTGFKAEMAAFQSVPVTGPGQATRINAVSQGLGADFHPEQKRRLAAIWTSQCAAPAGSRSRRRTARRRTRARAI